MEFHGGISHGKCVSSIKYTANEVVKLILFIYLFI